MPSSKREILPKPIKAAFAFIGSSSEAPALATYVNSYQHRERVPEMTGWRAHIA